MNTTTPTAIITQLATVLEALTPAISTTPAKLFRRSKSPNRPLRTWIPDAGGNDMLRKFDLFRDGSRLNIGINHPEANLISVPLTLTVAYPAVPKLYALTELYDLEALIESDALQLHDAILGPSALVSGDQAFLDVEILRTDQSDERHWYQDLTMTAVFYTAQRLT